MKKNTGSEGSEGVRDYSDLGTASGRDSEEVTFEQRSEVRSRPSRG